MSELTLEWTENGQFRKHTLHDQLQTKSPSVFRLGRDPDRCDLVFHDRSVSALHVEISINLIQKIAVLKNLRPTNPPLVNGLQVLDGEAPVGVGSRINLGRVELVVAALIFDTPIHPSEPKVPSQEYGLKCPNLGCGKVSAYSNETLKRGCPWCGFSLAAANSVVMIPHSPRGDKI